MSLHPSSRDGLRLSDASPLDHPSLEVSPASKSAQKFRHNQAPNTANFFSPTDVVSNKSASTGKPIWPNLSDDHALHQFHKRLPGILSGADYNEVWGIELSAASPPDFDTLKILQKFLRANQNNLDKGAEQLENTLKWRKEFKPREQLEKLFSERKYKGLGYITKVMVPVPGGEPVEKVICWNVYGDVANIKETFGDLEEYVFLH